MKKNKINFFKFLFINIKKNYNFLHIMQNKKKKFLRK